jgi:hypothetical protein
MRCFHHRPAPDDDRYEQDPWSDLDNIQKESDEGEYAGSRNACGQKAYSTEKCLQQCDINDAARYVAYG